MTEKELMDMEAAMTKEKIIERAEQIRRIDFPEQTGDEA